TLAGQGQAYEQLVRRWAGRVTAVCHARVGRAGVAEDMAQEALLRGFRALRSLEDPDKFGPWLCGIAMRACLDWLKAKERTQVPFSVLSRNGDTEAVLGSRAEADSPSAEQAEELDLLLAEVERLPEECRQVIMLYYYVD